MIIIINIVKRPYSNLLNVLQVKSLLRRIETRESTDMSAPRNNSIYPAQNASPARPSTPSTPSTSLTSNRAGLLCQTSSAPDQSASASATSTPPAPNPSRFRNADSLPIPSPWPVSPIRANVGVQDDGRRCLHQDVYPCFCRGDTELQGYVCRRCRFERCPVNAMLRRETAEVLRRALEAEVARGRGCWLFEEELRSALETARRREGGSSH
ncbi:hypothetical protein LZ31DRAFT_595202 [Colletotrichum somersetense]|nr:hypothetical protein LZ31DRAFT_595202 [Colletotrichum somersetense]